MSEPRLGIQSYPVSKLQGGSLVAVDQQISEETPLTVYLNGRELMTMLCSPVDRKQLALGFLVSEGMIGSIADLTMLSIDDDRGLVWAEADNVRPDVGKMYFKRCLTACCGRGRGEFYFANDARVTKRVDSTLSVRGSEVNGYVGLLEEASATHRITYGVHSGAIVANGELLFYSEDIGRHNVFDKLYGKCLEAGVAMTDKAIVFSGRVSSEILLKAGKMGVPVIIARSVPTTLAVDLAEELGITLIGAAKGDWFFVYTHENRIEL